MTLSSNCPALPIVVDELSGIVAVGAVTHLIFTLRSPGVYDGRMVRAVQVRLVVPTDRVAAIGKLLLAGRLDPSVPVDDNGEPVGLH